MNSQESRKIAEDTPAIILRYDSHLHLEYASPQALEIIPENERAQWDAAIQEVFQSGQPRDFDFELPEDRTFRLKLLPEGGPDAAIHHVLAMAVETTIVREREERLRILADCPSLIWVTDADGRNQFVNPQHPNRERSFDWQALIHPEDAAVYMAGLTCAVRERKSFRSEIRIGQADGVWRWVTTLAEPRFSANLHQVLMNLIVNARDAMPRGGTITIQTANMDAGQGREPQVLMSVSDTGTGIAKAIQDRIFDPFFTTKGEAEGTGLGLSTVYGIIEQCGGSISLVSEPGQGATFKICLPRIGATPAPREGAGADRGNLQGGETVLVVEDQAPVRKLVTQTLKSYGYRVLEASDGPAALRLAESEIEPIHLMVTDVVMPYMTGGELAQNFQRLHPEIKVLYMSGYGAGVIASRGVLHPGAQFIAKPFSPDALAAKVRETLSVRRDRKPQ